MAWATNTMVRVVVMMMMIITAIAITIIKPLLFRMMRINNNTRINNHNSSNNIMMLLLVIVMVPRNIRKSSIRRLMTKNDNDGQLHLCPLTACISSTGHLSGSIMGWYLWC